MSALSIKEALKYIIPKIYPQLLSWIGTKSEYLGGGIIFLNEHRKWKEEWIFNHGYFLFLSLGSKRVGMTYVFLCCQEKTLKLQLLRWKAASHSSLIKAERSIKLNNTK